MGARLGSIIGWLLLVACVAVVGSAIVYEIGVRLRL